MSSVMTTSDILVTRIALLLLQRPAKDNSKCIRGFSVKLTCFLLPEWIQNKNLCERYKQVVSFEEIMVMVELLPR